MEDNSAMISITTRSELIDLFMRMDNGGYDITDEELLPILCEWGKKALEEKDPHLASLIRSHAKSYNSPDSRLGRGDAFIYSQLSKYVPGLIGYSELREKIRDVVNAGSENYDVWLECLAEYFAAAGVGKVLNFWEEICEEMYIDDDRKKKLRELFWEKVIENPALENVLFEELRSNKQLRKTLCDFAKSNKYSLPPCFDKNLGRKRAMAATKQRREQKKAVDRSTAGRVITAIICLIVVGACFFFRYLPFVKPVITSSSDATVVVSQMNAQYATDLVSSEYESITAASGKVKTIFTTTIYNTSEKTLKKFSYKVTFYDSEQNKIISKRYKISKPIAPYESKTFTNELEYASSTGVTVSSIKVSTAKLGFERSLKLGWHIVIAVAASIIAILFGCDSSTDAGVLWTVLMALNMCLYMLFTTNYIYIFLPLALICPIAYFANIGSRNFSAIGVIALLINIALTALHILCFFM